MVFIFSLIPWPFMSYLFLVLICVTRPCNVRWYITVRYQKLKDTEIEELIAGRNAAQRRTTNV